MPNRHDFTPLSWATVSVLLAALGCTPGSPDQTPSVAGDPVTAGQPVTTGRLADVPDQLDTRDRRPSVEGHFTGILRRAEAAPPLNTLHVWNLTLVDANGSPVIDAAIRVDGGMPQHAHGLPTQPRIGRSTDAGVYRVEGVKFHMHGWWRLTFDVQAAERRDVLHFDFVVD